VWWILASVARAAVGDTGTDTGVDGGTPTSTDPAADLDQDGDGFTPNQGDCDDTTADATPGKPEVCGDHVDNDCNGLYDDHCDDAAHLASLGGGGGCTGGGGIAGTQSVVLLPLIFWWRRRSSR